MASNATSDQTIPFTSSGVSSPQDQSIMINHSGKEADDEEEEVLCRVCRCTVTSELDDPLLHPCACRGSIKFVHQSCLIRWKKYSRSNRCQVCGHNYSFPRIFDVKAPSRWSGLQFLGRLAIVLFVWFVVVPLVTAQVWDAMFMSFREFGGFHWLHSYMTIFVRAVYGLVVFHITVCVTTVSVIFFVVVTMDDKPNDRVGPPDERNESLSEFITKFIGVRGPAIDLMKNAFLGQLVISLVHVIGVFVPFSLGRIVLYLMNNSKYGLTGHASNSTTVAVGYLSMIVPCVIVRGLYILFYIILKICVKVGGHLTC